MERDASISSDPTSIRRDRHPVLPPWEARSVSQVPFMEPGSPPHTRRDDHGFFAQAASHAKHRPQFSASMSAPCGAENSFQAANYSNVDPCKTTVPLASAASSDGQAHHETSSHQFSAHNRPAYEDPSSFKPTFRKAASQPPPSYVPQAPPTPPDSVSRASLRSASASPPIRSATKALPGTMSSRENRNRSISHARAKAKSRDKQLERNAAKEDQTGLGKRFKSAFREMFKKDPVDDTQFERISDRHWTEEY